jgi:hypothetical protein
MSYFGVISGLVLSSPSVSHITSNYEHLKKNFYISARGLPVFADSIFSGIEWTPDNDITYDSSEFINVNNWKLDIDVLTYEDEADEEDYHPITSLYYIANYFFKIYDIKINGEVILYDSSSTNQQVVVYDIIDSKFIYRVNRSIEYTRHWKNCLDYENGNTVLDNDYPPCDTNLNPNVFINFIQNYSLYNPVRFTAAEIFEDTIEFLI